MKAIVLAAGRGTRLQPLTDNRSKHLLEIAGKPILKRILDDLLNIQKIDEIVVVVHYKSKLIEKALLEWYKTTEKIRIIEQESPNGTGDAVDVALKSRTDFSDFVVVNGDVLFADSYSEIVQSFEQDNEAEALIAGTKVENPSAFGVLSYEGSYLQTIIEKPKTAPDNSLINAGFYIFPKDAISLFAELEYSERGERELTDVIDQLIQKQKKIVVHECQSGWFDVGKPWQLLEANEFFMKREQDEFQIIGEVEEGVNLHGKVHIAQGARIRSGVYIEGPVFVDEGADIGPNCYIRSNTYLGKNTRVGNACEVKNSILYEDTHAAHLSYIGDSVIGMHCNLGAGTITANLRHDGKNIKLTVKDKRVDTGRRKLGVVMGDNVKTGIGVYLLPGVKISSGTWINAGEVITRDC